MGNASAATFLPMTTSPGAEQNTSVAEGGSVTLYPFGYNKCARAFSVNGHHDAGAGGTPWTMKTLLEASAADAVAHAKDGATISTRTRARSRDTGGDFVAAGGDMCWLTSESCPYGSPKPPSSIGRSDRAVTCRIGP